MKILYGVQGTGNGHITRARIMAPLLTAAGIETDYLFSGRPRDQFFEMDPFGAYQWRRGLSFTTQGGNVKFLQTARDNNIAQFLKDISDLDLSGYDLVVNDFEPVTAWAARRQKKTLVGIGHQYAFRFPIPKTQGDPLAEFVMRYFAPADVGIGLHWDHFGHPILPPIIDTHDGQTLPPIEPDKFLIYLPFEEPEDIVQALEKLDGYRFYYYTARYPERCPDHIQLRKLSRSGFQKDLLNCAGIISNAGFELPSEALHLGKKLLVKPLLGQAEQLSNALALTRLELGTVMRRIDSAVIADWLERAEPVQMSFPNVGQALAEWLLQGDWRLQEDWVQGVWNGVQRRSLHEPGASALRKSA